MKLHIVTTVDTSETADGKSRIVKVCRNRDEAVKYVNEDMKAYIEDANGMSLEVEKDKMSIHTSDYQYGCEWNIEEIEVLIPDKEHIIAACRVLVDNGIEPDEADVVLQAICYTLLDMEIYPCQKEKNNGLHNGI